MYTFSLDLSDRVGNLGSLLGTNSFWWFITGTLTKPEDVAYEPMTGVDWTTGTNGPMLLEGTTLTVLPSMTSTVGGGGL